MSFVLWVVGGFFALMVGMQVLVRVRARLQTGKAVPPLGGALGKHVANGRRALVYFHSPGCAACRAITPTMKTLSQTKEGVFVVDVSQELATAQALGVMATPTFVAIDGGKIARFHVGPAPADLVAAFSG